MVRKLLLALTPATCFAQMQIQIPSLKEVWPSATCFFVAGVANGTHEALLWRYSSFKRNFPGANDQYWNPEISWKNKYKNRDYGQGRAYPGSLTWLVWTTDGKHMLSMARAATEMTGAVLYVHVRRKHWTYFVSKGLILATCYGLGSWLTYELAFNRVEN